MIWLPIASAPRDGSDFLAYAPHPTWPLISQARYERGLGVLFSDTNMMGLRPSHWMPLPSPPEAQS